MMFRLFMDVGNNSIKIAWGMAESPIAGLPSKHSTKSRILIEPGITAVFQSFNKVCNQV